MSGPYTDRPAIRPGLLLAFLSLVLTSAAGAFNGDGRNYDARVAYNQGFQAPAAAAQLDAAAQLGAAAANLDLAVTYDDTTGATRTLSNRVGYLTGAAPGEPLDLALDFVHAHLDLLGLGPADLAEYEVTDNVFSAVTGATHLYLRQMHLGLPLYNGQLHVNLNRDGRILSVNNAFVPELAAAANASAPVLTAADAVTAAAAHLGLQLPRSVSVTREEAGPAQATTLAAPGISTEAVAAQLMWLPIRRGEVRLVWNFQLHTPDGLHVYDFTVDAATGGVWTRFDWVNAADYRVFPQPVESPIHSASPPPADGRILVMGPENATASPLGWHDTGTTSFTIMRGNNVHAYDDRDGNQAPPASEPSCGAGLLCDFNFPINFGTATPANYTSAAVANLFYWANIIHDVQYQYGFDEAGGNFQVNNFGNGGLGNDDVRAQAQDQGSLCPNNAFFSTPPDGTRPLMKMCLWTSSNPDRDFSWDSGVMVHEYGHGISNRLVGGPANVNCLNNQQQPGEGLSDWWFLAYTAEAGDQGTDRRGAGTYILGQTTNGNGVRNQPYSTNPAINSHTYASINGLSVPHGVGEVWAQAAWEAYWALVDHHGFDADLYDALGNAGNQRMMLYVNEGLKNTICSPTFTNVRDGILQAAVDNHSGEDVCRLWTAFAAFGLGTNAVSGGPNSTNPTNGFNLPAECAAAIFSDGFESGSTSAWSSTVP